MANKIGPHRFNEICRLCMENGNTFNPLYPLFLQHTNCGRLSKDKNESFLHILNTCIGLKVSDQTTQNKNPSGIGKHFVARLGTAQ